MPTNATWPEALGLESRRFDLPGLRMHAAVAGPEDGPLAILLHGFPETGYSWRHQIDPLAAAGYRVIVPDQRGYNLTDKTSPYDTRTLVEDVVHLMDACGRDAACVAGHDWGAVVAWSLAGRYPERVRRLAILNVPHPRVMQSALLGADIRQMLRSWYIFWVQLPRLPEFVLSRGNYAPLRAALLWTSRRGTFTRQDIEHYVRAWRQPGALTAMIGWYRALPRGWARAMTGRAVRRISVPTIILWGERDVALRVALAVQSAALLDNGRLVRFPRATHWVHEDYPQEITRLILEHFDLT